MAYDAHLEERINRALEEQHINYSSKKMMGGLCYMLDDKMLCGLLKDKTTGKHLLMARIGEDFFEDALALPHVRPMTFTGRSMKGYVFVEEDGFDMEKDLVFWLGKCLTFNPFAKSSKKKRFKP